MTVWLTFKKQLYLSYGWWPKWPKRPNQQLPIVVTGDGWWWSRGLRRMIQWLPSPALVLRRQVVVLKKWHSCWNELFFMLASWIHMWWKFVLINMFWRFKYIQIVRSFYMLIVWLKEHLTQMTKVYDISSIDPTRTPCRAHNLCTILHSSSVFFWGISLPKDPGPAHFVTFLV